MRSSVAAPLIATCVSVVTSLAVPLVAQRADRLDGKNVSIAQTTFKGQSAVQLIAAPNAGNGTSYAVVKDTSFRDGTIEVDLAGQPAAGADSGARGFIGIAQYSAHPDFDFARSREEAPEKYESYVDLQPGVWTRFKIEVEGRTARLYVHATEQPVLIVNDLKLEPRPGQVALWVGPGTEGYFANLKITAK